MKFKTVLFVDDDELDLMFVQEALAQSSLDVQAHYVTDAASAMRHFEEKGVPDLIVTDLSMPGMNGIEFTSMLKAHPTLRQIPVLMLSTSGAMKDIRTFYDAYGNAYICKPDSPAGYSAVIKAMGDFWFDVAC